jgi:hypothetical protein
MHLLACLTRESVSVRRANDYLVPVVSTFTRPAESMASRGPNCWVRWVSPKHLSFGTASGTIFISRLSASHEILSPTELCIERVIICTFAIFGHLAACTSDSRIVFVDSSACVFYSLDIAIDALRRRILAACFHPDSIIACLVDDQPVFLTLDRSTQFEKKLKPIVKPLPICNVNRLALNFDGVLLALGRDDNSVLVLHLNLRQPPICVCPSSPKDRVLSLIWSFRTHVLVVVRESGSFESYSPFGQHFCTTPFPPISRAISMCFDYESHRLYFSDMSRLSSVHFARTFDHFSATCCRVVDVVTSRTIWKDKQRMFPIVLIAHNQSTGAIVIASSTSFNVIGRDGDPVPASVWAVGFLRRFFLIFQDIYDGRIVLDFYRAELGDLFAFSRWSC